MKTCLFSRFLNVSKKCHGGLWTARGSPGQSGTDVVRGTYKGEMLENIVDGNVSFFHNKKGDIKKMPLFPFISEKIGIFFYIKITSYAYLLFSCEIPTELRTSASNVIE